MFGAVVVLGAGFGGISAAVELAKAGREVVLVDERERFTMGLVALRALEGRTDGADHARPLAALSRHGIRVVRATATHIDPAAKRVGTSAGELTYDKLVVALGAATRVPAGWPAEAHDLYTLDGARTFGEKARAMGRGRALVLAHSMPFKCPPAPYEAAMLTRSVAPGVDVTIATPEPHPLPVFGPVVGARMRELVEARGVRVLNGRTVASVGEGRVAFTDGSEVAYDLLGIVPQHTPPPLVSTLSPDGGWLPVDARTMRTAHMDVWAVGDCTLLKLPNGKPIPKAGVLAEGQALAAARDILGLPGPFEGVGTCYVDIGAGLAVEGNGRFMLAEGPAMQMGDPSTEALARKHAFERDRLRAWFGS